MATTIGSSERPSNDGSGAVAPANTVPENTAQTQYPGTTTHATAATISTEEEQALQVLREYAFMTAQEAEDFPLPADNMEDAPERFNSITKLVKYIKDILTKKGKLFPVLQNWSRATKLSLETSMTATVEVRVDGIENQLIHMSEEIQLLKANDVTRAESNQIQVEEILKLR